MARLSYRNRVLLKKALRASAVVLALFLVGGMLLLLYLEPYVVYDRDGAYLDFSEDTAEEAQQVQNSPRPVISDPKIIYGGGAAVQQSLSELPGFYITTSMLRDTEATLQALKTLEGPCAIMVQMKSIFGNFYYASKLGGASTADVDMQAVEELLEYLRSGNFYLIAEVPAFADSSYALAHQSSGLPISGGALWLDDRGCYWLDPVDPGVLSYLANIGQELASMGFSEIAFSEFRFPQSEDIVYDATKTPPELLAEAATQLNTLLAETAMTVSFVTDDLAFPAQACSGRLFIPNLSGTQVGQYVQNFSEAASLKELVFLVNSKDARFEDKATMRPLLAEE